MKRIAWIKDDSVHLESTEEMMGERGYEVDNEIYAIKAVDMLTSGVKYELIVMGAQIAPGPELEENQISEIFGTEKFEVGSGYYVTIARRTIEIAKNDRSVNFETPIIVLGIYDPKNNSIGQNLETYFQEAGAHSYIHLNSEFKFEEFYDGLERIARGDD